MSDTNRTGAAFTAFEEEFFRVGSSPEELAKIESLSDLEESTEKTSMWQRLFRRSR